MTNSNGPSIEERDGEEALEAYGEPDDTEEEVGEGGSKRGAEPCDHPSKRMRLEESIETVKEEEEEESLERLKEEEDDATRHMFEPEAPLPMDAEETEVRREESGVETEEARVTEEEEEDMEKHMLEEVPAEMECKVEEHEEMEAEMEEMRVADDHLETKDGSRVEEVPTGDTIKVPDEGSGEVETSDTGGVQVETSEGRGEAEMTDKLEAEEEEREDEAQDPLSSVSSEACSSNGPHKTSEILTEVLRDSPIERVSEGSPDSAEESKDLVSQPQEVTEHKVGPGSLFYYKLYSSIT